MIRSIRIEGNTISLVPEGLDDAGSPLFYSNAMKLLVGPNGSGKTQALTALAKAVVNEDSSLAFSDHALNTYHVIYFSPSPFGAAQLLTENRLDVLTKPKRSNTAKPKARIHDTIRKSFDITNDLRITLEHEATSGHFSGLSVIRKALSQLSLTSKNRQTDPQILRMLDMLRTLRKESEEARSSWVREHGNRGDWFSSSPHKMVMEQEATFDAEIINIVSAKLGEVYPLNLRALAWTIERAKREKHDVALSLLPKFGLNAIPSTKHPKGQKDFIDCVTRLSNLAGKLGQPSLSRSAYPLSSTTLRTLNDTDVTGVADIGYLQSSSGLSALVHQLTQIDAAIRKVPAAKQKHLVLLIDEGDTFLHLEWQQRYVKFINDYMALVGRMFASTQVVMTTHSPMLMSDFPRQSIHRFESHDEQGTNHSRHSADLPLRSFGAPLEVIVRSAGNAGTIGLFSADFISGLLEKADQGELIPDWKIDLIDDPVLRDFLASYNAHRKGTDYAHRSS